MFSNILNWFRPKTTLLPWQQAELVAANYLIKNGLVIVKRNYRATNGKGEIDIVAFDTNNTIIFIEVKQRSKTHYGAAHNSIDHHKQRKIILAAQQYLQENFRARAYNKRFDAVLINGKINDPETKIQWIKAAFSADIAKK